MIRSGLKKLAAQKKKSVMASVKQRHIDQIIDDVSSGCVNGNGQIQSDLVKLMDDETNAVTPVLLQNVTRNGNGGNVMVLPQSVEVHASANHEQLSGSCQDENVPNSCEVGQESTLTQTANTVRPNVMEVNWANETTQDHDNRGLSMTRPSIARSIGVSGTERQPMMEQSSQHEGARLEAVPNNVANDNQDPELVRSPMAQQSGLMTTIPVEDVRVNDGDDQQSLSAMMG